MAVPVTYSITRARHSRFIDTGLPLNTDITPYFEEITALDIDLFSTTDMCTFGACSAVDNIGNALTGDPVLVKDVTDDPSMHSTKSFLVSSAAAGSFSFKLECYSDVGITPFYSESIPIEIIDC